MADPIRWGILSTANMRVIDMLLQSAREHAQN